MITLPVADSESQRVEMVRSFGLINHPRESLHDEIASLARDLSGAEAGLVSLVDSERNWFAGVANFADADQCRWSSFCTHVVAEPDAPLWIEDAGLDFRFAANPLVVGAPYLRFYAGVPILVNGHAVGSLCVLDGKPKSPDPKIIARLQRLAMIVGDDLGHRHQVQILRHHELDGLLGLFRLTRNGQDVFIGTGIDIKDGLPKRLYDFHRQSDSGRDYHAGRLIYEHRDQLEVQVLITGTDREAQRIARQLKRAMVERHRPAWNTPAPVRAKRAAKPPRKPSPRPATSAASAISPPA